MDWRLAHRIAGMAAAQAHRDLEIDRSTYVPVHNALLGAGLAVVARPMGRLFGMYLAPNDEQPAGVLLNAGLGVVNQRHTAAHELGHHCQGHSTAVDSDFDRSASWGDGSWPDHEKVAEAFAAWFLMPLPAVKAAVQRIAGGRQIQPIHAYLVSTALGTSYAGTVRHLSNLRLISRTTSDRWSAIAPSKLKKEITGGRPVEGNVRVHVVMPSMIDQTVHVDVGDMLVLYIDGAQFEPSSVLKLRADLNKPGHAPVVTVTDELPTECAATIEAPGSEGPLQVRLARESPRNGVGDIWP